LRDIGVDYVQGYCIGMPAPIADLSAALGSKRGTQAG
jgi:EAL domain-containing protein (putative c-di-GMP-specific phosphodiesterase class I)